MIREGYNPRSPQSAHECHGRQFLLARLCGSQQARPGDRGPTKHQGDRFLGRSPLDQRREGREYRSSSCNACDLRERSRRIDGSYDKLNRQ